MIKADYIEISQSKSALREKPGKKALALSVSGGYRQRQEKGAHQNKRPKGQRHQPGGVEPAGADKMILDKAAQPF
jgi:hypothetical protein